MGRVPFKPSFYKGLFEWGDDDYWGSESEIELDETEGSEAEHNSLATHDDDFCTSHES